MKKILTLATVVALVVSSSIALAQNGGDETVIKPPVRGGQQQELPEKPKSQQDSGFKILLPGKTFYVAVRFQDSLDLQDCPFDKFDLQASLKSAICNELSASGITPMIAGNDSARDMAAIGVFHMRRDEVPHDGLGVANPTFVMAVPILLSQTETIRSGSRNGWGVSRSASDRTNGLSFTVSPVIMTMDGTGVPGWGLQTHSHTVNLLTGKDFSVSYEDGHGILRLINGGDVQYHEESKGKIPEELQRQLAEWAHVIVGDLVDRIRDTAGN